MALRVIPFSCIDGLQKKVEGYQIYIKNQENISCIVKHEKNIPKNNTSQSTTQKTLNNMNKTKTGGDLGYSEMLNRPFFACDTQRVVNGSTIPVISLIW